MKVYIFFSALFSRKRSGEEKPLHNFHFLKTGLPLSLSLPPRLRWSYLPHGESYFSTGRSNTSSSRATSETAEPSCWSVTDTGWMWTTVNCTTTPWSWPELIPACFVLVASVYLVSSKIYHPWTKKEDLWSSFSFWISGSASPPILFRGIFSSTVCLSVCLRVAADWYSIRHPRRVGSSRFCFSLRFCKFGERGWQLDTSVFPIGFDAIVAAEWSRALRHLVQFLEPLQFMHRNLNRILTVIRLSNEVPNRIRRRQGAFRLVVRAVLRLPSREVVLQLTRNRSDCEEVNGVQSENRLKNLFHRCADKFSARLLNAPDRHPDS